MSNQYNYKFWELGRQANEQKRAQERFDEAQEKHRAITQGIILNFPPLQDVEQHDITNSEATTTAVDVDIDPETGDAIEDTNTQE